MVGLWVVSEVKRLGLGTQVGDNTTARAEIYQPTFCCSNKISEAGYFVKLKVLFS